jgi:uroporphyrinogen-III synthase
MVLQGKRILGTRAKAQASALSLQIKKYGGIPVELPLITCKEVEDKRAIHEAINLIHTYNWIVFTSKNGIDFFLKEYTKLKGTTKLPCNIAVVGKKTEDILETYGLKADLIPEFFVAESLLESLLKVIQKGERILFPRGNLARNVIPISLRENNIYVNELDVYETVIEKSSKDCLYKAIKEQEIDVVTFTSSSTVDNFVTLLEGTNWRNYIGNIMFASIGPITSKTMVKYDLPVHVEPKEYTIQGMLNSVMDSLEEDNKC